MQLHVRSPVDIRKLYRRVAPDGPEGARPVRLHRPADPRSHKGRPGAGQLALDALEVLDADRQAGPYGWGYHWDMQTRWSFYPAGSPSIVHTAFAVSALLEAERDAGRTDLGDRARAAAQWVLDRLWIEPRGSSRTTRTAARTFTTPTCSAPGWCGPRSATSSRRASARCARSSGRSPISAPTGHGRTARATTSAGPTRSTPATCCGASSGCAASTPHSRARSRWVHASTSGSSARVERGACGQTGRTRRMPTRPGPGSRRWRSCRDAGLVSPGLLDRVADRVLAAVVRDGHAVFRRYREVYIRSFTICAGATLTWHSGSRMQRSRLPAWPTPPRPRRRRSARHTLRCNRNRRPRRRSTDATRP